MDDCLTWRQNIVLWMCVQIFNSIVHFHAPVLFLLSFTFNSILFLYLHLPKSDIPGAVVEAKAQLVGIRERVRNDIEGSFPSSTPGIVSANRRIISATNPDPKDAAELLRYFFVI